MWIWTGAALLRWARATSGDGPDGAGIVVLGGRYYTEARPALLKGRSCDALFVSQKKTVFPVSWHG